MPVVRKFRRFKTEEPEHMPETRQPPEVSPEDKTPAALLGEQQIFPGSAEFEMSPEYDRLFKAFVAFRKEAPNVNKDTAGYNYSYTSLANLLDTLQPHLSKHGLAIMQFPISGSNGLGVLTVLLHESGQYIRSRFILPMPSLKGTNITQDAGAAITYARRYGISSVLCVASEEDTDANYKKYR